MWSWTSKSSLLCAYGLVMVVVVTSSFLVIVSESFLLSISSSTTTTKTRRRKTQIRHDIQEHQKGHFCQRFPPNLYQSVCRHGRITVLSSQEQNTIEKEKEKSATIKTRRKNRSWEESFQLLLSYKEKHGNCNVPYSYKDDSRLGRWVVDQRSNKERLSDDRIAKLNDLGFSWSNEIFEEQWEEMFGRLVQYAEENDGDCNIPNNEGDDVNKELYEWVSKQRQRKSLLSKERRTKLDNLGFLWEDANKVKADQKWNAQYENLKLYKQKYGHCRVPQRWEEDPTLGRWVDKQRKKYRKGQLREDRQTKLEEMDFTWKVRDGRKRDYVKLDLKWFVKFGKLLAFHEEYGHCDVPQLYKKGKSLGEWLGTQRMNQKNGTLRGNRKEMLDDIGFTWSFDDQRDAQWREKYKELKSFKEQNGHIRLPKGSLESWACHQRVNFAAGKMQHERKALLDEIEFRWEIDG